MESKIMNLETAGMINPNEKDKSVPSTRTEDQDNGTEDIQENVNATDATIKTIEWKMKIKPLLLSLKN